MSAGRTDGRGAALLKSRITRYINECAAEDLPPTPAGLALALDMRTEDLTGARLPEAQRQAIGRALQRIEAETMQRALNGRSGAKGVEVILQQTSGQTGDDELSALPDDELEKQMAAVAAEIGKALGGGAD